MKGVVLFLVITLTTIYNLDAFLPAKLPQHHDMLRSTADEDKAQRFDKFDHSDIIWKVRPPPDTGRLKMIWLRLAANLMRLDCKVMRKEPPLVLCPKGGQAVLEAHVQRLDDSAKYEKIARFGFTTESGPALQPIQESVSDIYGLTPQLRVGVGAIIYMFVEEPYRKKNVGTLALDIISLIHAIQGCDFTVLVADDNGSGKLVEWYQENGYTLAPKLQDCFGSPNEIHGKTMIAPTRRIVPQGCFIKWW